MQVKEAEDDTSRLSELIALADAGLRAEEDDNTFFTQATAAVDEAEAAYYRRQAGQSNASEPSHNNRVVVNWSYAVSSLSDDSMSA